MGVSRGRGGTTREGGEGRGVSPPLPPRSARARAAPPPASPSLLPSPPERPACCSRAGSIPPSALPAAPLPGLRAPPRHVAAWCVCGGDGRGGRGGRVGRRHLC